MVQRIMDVTGLRSFVRAAADEAIAAVHPSRCIPACVHLDGNLLRVGDHALDLTPVQQLLVVGFGKASAAMAFSLEAILGDHITDGLVITADGYGVPTTRIRIVEAGHPLPDERGLRAAEGLLRLADTATEADVLLVLISGGGSSLLTLPHPTIALSDLRKTNDLLLRTGVPIGQVNAVRKHLSQVKGGRLAARAHPARVLSLILSDVPGDALDTIASGPTVADPSTFEDALKILAQCNLVDRVPQTVRHLLDEGARGEGLIEETPKPGDPILSQVQHVLIGSGEIAANAALRFAAARGFHTERLPQLLTGEARDVGTAMADRARALHRRARRSQSPHLLAGSGETTVTVAGPGDGGRNQELVLAAAVGIEGVDGLVIGSVGTDGRDGPTDAAGGLVDGGSAARLRDAGIDIDSVLRANDAYHALSATGDLVITGPTGTNVADLLLVAASG
jgi:hydroxypyruvate reductase